MAGIAREEHWRRQLDGPRRRFEGGASRESLTAWLQTVTCRFQPSSHLGAACTDDATRRIFKMRTPPGGVCIPRVSPFENSVSLRIRSQVSRLGIRQIRLIRPIDLSFVVDAGLPWSR